MRRTGMPGRLQVAEYEPAALSRTSEDRGGGLGGSVGHARGSPAVPAPGGAPCLREDGAGVLRQGPGLGLGDGSGGGAAVAEGDSRWIEHAHAARAISSSAATAWEGAGGGTAATEGTRKVLDCMHAACASSGLAGGNPGGDEPAALDSVAARAQSAEAPTRADQGMHAEELEDPVGCALRGAKRQRM